MNNVVYLRGVPTPRYRIQQNNQDRDLDLFVNMLANDPEHIARAKAKAARTERARRHSAAKAKKNGTLGSAVSILAVTIGLWMLALAGWAGRC